ncbi:ABC transporter permease [Sciscionella marina]|uniref:ABC transporter permease n=1 Tax=Sciscionella marina TaxID=508770 RepID=UPI00036DD908|nr:ABC transporter permease [Sciscionella marina]
MTYYQQQAYPPAGAPKVKLFAPTLPKAELRKFTTTSVWWGLLIPTVLLALGWSWIATSFVSFITDRVVEGTRSLGVSADIPDLPFASFALARAINISTIFPIVLGGLAMANEVQRRTMTTSYLTAPSRVSVLTAKFGFYAVVGAAYGVVVTGISSLGIWLGSVTGGHTQFLPSPGVWLGIVGAGILSTMLWTLLGVGVGALLGNVIATTLVLLLYTLLAENLLNLAVVRIGDHVPGFLINQSGSGIVSSIAADDVTSRITDLPPRLSEGMTEVMRFAAGAGGTYSWWIEALIFLVWTLIFAGLGWFVAQRRDVS